MLRDAGASSLLSHECILSVIVQMSSKSSSHPNCSFADSASSVLSGVMVSLTPVYQQKVQRPFELSEPVELKNVTHMFSVLNEVLSKAQGFARSLAFQQTKGTSSTSWYTKSSSKPQKEAWTWEGKDSQKWPRGSSKRAQGVPSHPADRENPCEHGLQWKDIGADMDESFLYPGQSSDPPCPVVHQQAMSKEDQQKYMQWIEKILDIDRRTSKDERLYCGYCDMNNHPTFTCKHFYKHRKEAAPHRCTLCSGLHAPFRCPRAQCNGGCGKPNWARIEYKLAKQEARAPDLRWGQDPAQPPTPPTEAQSQEAQLQQGPAAEQQPMCATTAMTHGIPNGPASSWQSAACPSIHKHRPWISPEGPRGSDSSKSRLLSCSESLEPRHHGASSHSRTNGVVLATCLDNGESRQSKLLEQWSSTSR